jgi:uncharacterized membrane protein
MKKLLFVLSLSLLLTSFLPQKTQAQGVQDFVINDFTADYYLSNQDKQGTLRIVEKIDVTFSGNNHGILRAIPKTYKNHQLQLKVNEISSSTSNKTQHTTYTENGNTVLKIGDPNRTFTGHQFYQIDYTLNNAIGFYDDHDELYWDINGDQWQQPFQKVTARLHLPDGLRLKQNLGQGGFACFAGGYGLSDRACTVSAEGNTVTFKATTQLTARQTLTILAGFEKGYFTSPTFLDTVSEYLSFIIAATLLPVLVFIYAFRRWRKYGRDPKGRGTIVPEYSAPDNLRPIEIGSLLDFKTDNKDLSATIIDLAVRGYIKIIETKKSKLIGKDKLSYSFELTGKEESELAFFEADILSGLRGLAPTGYTAEALKNKSSLIVPLDSLKQKFYTTANKLKSDVRKGMVTQGYFASNPLTAGGRLFVLGGLLFLSTFILGAFGMGLIIGLVMSALIAFGFGVLMPARTAKGVAALEASKGLKMYLETAEKDRIKMLQSPDAKYASAHEAPVKTVELFEKLLPYAMILGVENQWAKQFEGIYNTPPSWYEGNWTAFNTGLLMGSLNNSMNAVNTVAFSSPSSSGSSGFGGGGFSGGGGGGGGGGGW